MLPYNHNLKKRSQQLRNSQTDPEQLLWKHIRYKQMNGLQFYRQKPILQYIVDFYCPKAKLVIELDGSQHHTKEYKKKDQQRDCALENQGLTVLRFTNHEVMTNLEGVYEKIHETVNRSTVNTNPPLGKKRG
ncbi:MAG TPA: endonuclease domain-containing protein [bacterium]|nr:endonuclease domain-containing protein [bacterium]